MPSYVIKCDRETDRYVYWSDIVEAPHIHGDRKAVANYLLLYDRGTGAREVEERMARADATGSSAMWDIYKWTDGDNDILIVEQRGMLRRRKLWAFCEAYFGGPTRRDEWLDMLEPFDDCNEHDSPTGNTCPVLPCPDHVVWRG